MAIVVDSSALTNHLTDGIQLPDDDWHCPSLIDYEVLNALCGRELGRKLTALESLDALSEFRTMSITRYDADALLVDAWRMRHNITAYDASYVALAARLRIPLLTHDRPLAVAASRYCEVIAP